MAISKHPIDKLANASPGHARLGPSGAKKWMACPGSIVLESVFPNNSNKYADEGTACHDIGARCLISGQRASAYVGEYVPVHHEPEARRTVLFDEDMAELVQTYVDAVTARLDASPTATLWVETRVETSEWLGVPDQFGTADVATLDVYRGPDAMPGDVELGIDDAKFGRTPVDVEDNPQLMLYALGFITALMSGKPPTPVARRLRPRRQIVETEDESDLF